MRESKRNKRQIIKIIKFLIEMFILGLKQKRKVYTNRRVDEKDFIS